MKIMINYDLIDKTREAKTGFSLHKYTRVVGFTNGLVIPAMLLGGYIGNVEISSTLRSALNLFLYSLSYNALYSLVFSFSRRIEACEQLTQLATELNQFCVETDLELLKAVRQYAVKYSLNFDTFPPKIEQKKYIMVPVKNYWGNTERSLMQEHVMGTGAYTLSYGEPEINKSYSYARSKTFNSSR